MAEFSKLNKLENLLCRATFEVAFEKNDYGHHIVLQIDHCCLYILQAALLSNLKDILPQEEKLLRLLL